MIYPGKPNKYAASGTHSTHFMWYTLIGGETEQSKIAFATEYSIQ